MAEKKVLTPGADHPISVRPNANRVVIDFGGRVIGDTREALILSEASYPPVQYIPRKDVDMTLLTRTERMTYCPYKGDCNYYSISMAGERGANSVWSYEEPYAAVQEIKGYLAFYPDRVKITITAES